MRTTRSYIVSKMAGFSLIELMVAIVIVAILSAVALPSYQRYVAKTRRVDGQNLALDLAARLERHYLQYSTYTTNITAQTGLNTSSTSKEGYYGASIAACSGGNISACFVLTVTATQGGAQFTNDPSCRNFIITHTGTKTATTSASVDNTSECWR
jgi:type IV pilus assembly protein PilE